MPRLGCFMVQENTVMCPVWSVNVSTGCLYQNAFVTNCVWQCSKWYTDWRHHAYMYLNCVNTPTTFWTCLLTDRRLEIVTPKILIDETQVMFGNDGGWSTCCRRLWLVKIISTDLERLSVLLFAWTHVSMLLNSSSRALMLAGDISQRRSAPKLVFAVFDVWVYNTCI